MNAIMGKKIGMTQVFDESGAQIPVTVVEAGPCVVVQRKCTKTEGYESVQLGFIPQKESRLSRAERGHFKKGGVAAHRELREIRVEADEASEVGAVIDVSCMEGINYVDVTATSKGKGFQGVVRRYKFGGGRASHGSHFHRGPGSIGMCKDPGRVFKGTKMPGQMGNAQITTQNLKLVAVRPEDNVLLIQGSVPGPNGGLVIIRKSLKKA